MEKIYLTASEVAKTLKISKALAYRLITLGRIPCTRYHRRVIVKKEVLNRFMMNDSTTNTYLDSQEDEPAL